MKMTIAGTTVGARELRAALARVVPEHLGIEQRGKRRWVILPPDVRSATLDDLAAEIGGEIVVVEVEMALGGRGSDLFAERYTLPSGEGAIDLSEDARELLHDWITEGSGFDEEEAALELAWELIDDDLAAPAPKDPKNFEDRWAEALIEHLVATGGMELRSKHRPTTDLAHELQFDDSDLGSRLFEALVSSTTVDEIFLDEAELLGAARATRPRRRA